MPKIIVTFVSLSVFALLAAFASACSPSMAPNSDWQPRPPPSLTGAGPR